MVDIAQKVQNATEEIDVEAAIDRLAKLSPIAYDRVRVQEKNRLGIQQKTLDSQVEKRRKVEGGGDQKIQGRAIELPEPEPWPEPVDGNELMQDAVWAIRRYLFLPPHADHALAFWAIHTHAFTCFDTTPRLQLTSPLPECGKTTTLRVVRRLVTRPLLAGNVSSAVVFRTVELVRPTLLIDEADTFANQNDELRGILNSGHERNGSVIRAVGEDNEPRQFSTWTPVAIAAIDRLPATIESRSITIEMQRRSSDVVLDRLRENKPCELDDIARRIARWAKDNRDSLAEAEPAMPDALGDRAQDNWRGMIAIADLIGGDWPTIARQAAVALSSRNTDNEPVKVLLLSDLRDIFGDSDAMFTKDILPRLHAMDSRPWKEYGRKALPISDIQLAKILKSFNVASTTLNIQSERFKGYKKRALNSLFSQYLPSRPVTPLPSLETAAYGDFQAVTSTGKVTGTIPPKPAETLNGNGVTARNGGLGGRSTKFTLSMHQMRRFSRYPGQGGNLADRRRNADTQRGVPA